VTVWLLRLLFTVWRTFQKIVFTLDDFDFERLARQYLNGETPLSESVNVRVSENKEEGYKEITVTKTYRKPLDAKEAWEGIVKQMAQELQ